ncbi:MAG: Crp/Fnr family transcriptional regulator [Bacillota bacterium]|jgi:CRP-like cAMP-binding protein
MNTLAIFKGISQPDLDEMLNCFKPVIKQFKTGETIMQKSYTDNTIGILLNGTAHMYYFDENGTSAVLEHYIENSVFGEFFMLPIESFEYLIVADSSCTVMFIDYNHVIHPCQRSCEHHSQLIGNVIQMTVHKVRMLTLRINILSQKNVRQKLMTYLEYQSLINNSKTFTIPISLVELSEYLCVDRSAIMKELHNLRNENRIKSKGRHFTLLP